MNQKHIKLNDIRGPLKAHQVFIPILSPHWRFLGALMSLSLAFEGGAGVLGAEPDENIDEIKDEIRYELDRSEKEEEEAYFANHLSEMIQLYDNLVTENKDIINEPSIQYYHDCYDDLIDLEWVRLDKNKAPPADGNQETQSNSSQWYYLPEWTLNIFSGAFSFK